MSVRGPIDVVELISKLTHLSLVKYPKSLKATLSGAKLESFAQINKNGFDQYLRHDIFYTLLKMVKVY
jgi:hypothetical protein